MRVLLDFRNWRVILFGFNPAPKFAFFLPTSPPFLACFQPFPRVRTFSCSSQEKVRKKKDAAQTPRRLGAPKPEFRMAIRILCGSERDRGLTGPWWNVKKEGQSRAQKPIL